MPVTSAVVVGAGIAGLSTALSLAHHGIHADILEQAPQLGEVGAGLQLSPNASRVLQALGVLQDIEAHWRRPDYINLASGLSLKTLAAVPAGSFAENRWGAPYGVLHRSTLQQSLLSVVLKNPLIRLHLGTRIEDAGRKQLAELVGHSPDVVIGADGVWSRTRIMIPGAPEVSFSGNVAWRFTLPAKGGPGFLDPANVTAYLGPNCHLVAYPLREISGYNIVAISAGVSPGETWSATGTEAQKALLARAFAGWHPSLQSMIASAPALNYWPLFQAGPGQWHGGGDTVLVGDAAHAMMPFSAQGAAMAIEDGFDLAALLAHHPLQTALDRYQSLRQARAARVRQRGAFNKFVYHARGPIRMGRDLVLALRPPQSLASDLDWLYGYRAGEQV
ncbi:FAD-dependent monooxygenase [Rhizobium sp. RU36D]|uniref:FAD-dependent monooxygenase n=1 Tax=Rhizobium sp. RU36D TaxID=1907415 RepID=UPI0009D7BB1C|nr:FAD-dependent monooxygenase [Rhizobium sp. RU36D]SMC66931.1 salicylate hydroxylase [Rhizobium sp. RU36D]